MDKFNYEANGYNRSEVNKFVNDVIKETEGIIRKCKEQKKEIEDLKDKLSHYEELENTLKQSLINAEKTADNVMSQMLYNFFSYIFVCNNNIL